MAYIKLLALVLISGLACSVQAKQTTRYVLLIDHGKKAGEQIVEHSDNGVTRVHYIFKNNGRGPELDEQFRVAPDGTLSEYQVKGRSTFDAKINEHFSRSGDKASWSSASEKGETTVSGPALYMPMYSSLEIFSVAISALAQRADGKLPLLPAGTLMQRKLDEVDVMHAGKSQRVQLLALTGQGLSPSFVWATTGEKPRMFALLIPGYQLAIEEGYEEAGKLLDAHQKLAEATLLKDMAARLEHPLNGLTLIRNTRVFDSEKAELGTLSDVYVLRGKITAVLAAGSPSQGVDNEIDAAGRIMLPGLFDMHAHFNRWQGGLHLASGVTSVRDMGNDNAMMQQMLDETANGDLLAPQLVPAGFLEGESKYSARMGFVIKSPQEAKNAIDWYAEHGYPQLKIYNSFPHEMVRDTVAYAHSRGMRVSGHVPAFMRAKDVVEQGFDEIQHINQVLLNFFVTPTTDTRTLERFRLPAEKVAGLDFDSTPVQDFIALLKQHHTVIDPTLTTFDFIRQRSGETSEAYAAVSDHMPVDIQRDFRFSSMNIPNDATAKRYAMSYTKMIEFVGRMFHAGIPLVAGTDALAGFTLQRELELYVQAGISPAQTLQIATRNGARYTGTSEQRGNIMPGKLADLVLVDGDPTSNISDIRKIALVITQGKLISPSEVFDEFGIKPFVEKPPTLHVLTKPVASTSASSNSVATSHVFGTMTGEK